MSATRGGVVFLGLTQRRDTDAFGGAPVVIVNLANHFAHRGVPVEVLVFAGREVTRLPFDFDPGVTVHLLRGGSRAVLFGQVLLHLLRARPRAVLAVGNKANALAAAASRVPAVRARLWATLHHSLSAEMRGWKPDKRARRIRMWRRVLGRSAGLIAVSRGVAEDFVDAVGSGAEKVRVIYNPIVEPGLAARAAQPADHPWLDGRGPPVILGVGRLTAQKDFATLVAAFALVRRHRPCRLLIIGEGEERAALAALAAALGVTDAVDLAGFRRNPLPYMREAALVALSSRWEGFGNVLVEALFCGTPVVSTDCPHGPREVLEDGRHGRLVPVGDPQALAAALIATLDEPPDRDSLRARAAAFSVQASGERYLEAMDMAPAHAG